MGLPSVSEDIKLKEPKENGGTWRTGFVKVETSLTKGKLHAARTPSQRRMPTVRARIYAALLEK